MDKYTEAKKFFNAYYKCIKNRKIYTKTKSLFYKFLDDSYNLLADYVKNFGPLALNIDENKIYFENKIIYEDTNKITSLPLYFYRNGIRSITFLEEIKKEELQKFIDIVSEHDFAVHMNLSEDLWLENFTNIIFYVVEEEPKDYSWIIETEKKEENYNFSVEKIGLSPFMDFNKIEEKEDFSEITNLLESEKKESILNVIIKIYEIETDNQRKDEIILFIKDHTAHSIQECKISDLLIILDFSKKFPVLNDIFKEIIFAPDAIDLYLNCLVNKENKDELKKLLIEGKRDVLPHIKNFINKNPDSHKFFPFFSEVIKNICEVDKNALELMFPPSINFIPYLLEIIQKMRVPSYTKLILPLLRISDVKNLVLKTFLEIASREELIEFVDDPDETIRINVLKRIKFIENKDEYEIFKNKLTDKNFWFLNKDEKENIIRIIASYKKNDVIILLDKMLKKFSFKKDVLETKIFIMKTLSKLGDMGINVLLKYKNSFLLKKIVKEVLKDYGKN